MWNSNYKDWLWHILTISPHAKCYYSIKSSSYQFCVHFWFDVSGECQKRLWTRTNTRHIDDDMIHYAYNPRYKCLHTFSTLMLAFALVSMNFIPYSNASWQKTGEVKMTSINIWCLAHRHVFVVFIPSIPSKLKVRMPKIPSAQSFDLRCNFFCFTLVCQY